MKYSLDSLRGQQRELKAPHLSPYPIDVRRKIIMSIATSKTP